LPNILNVACSNEENIFDEPDRLAGYIFRSSHLIGNQPARFFHVVFEALPAISLMRNRLR
jgi:hypothetical protein